MSDDSTRKCHRVWPRKHQEIARSSYRRDFHAQDLKKHTIDLRAWTTCHTPRRNPWHIHSRALGLRLRRRRAYQALHRPLPPHQRTREFLLYPRFCSRKTLVRSEEHTSELQSRGHLVCRLLLEKKK